MDFVEGMGDTSGVLEIPVDDIGRCEVYRDRVRITFAAHHPGGVRAPVAIVMTVAAWKAARPNHQKMHELIYGETIDLEAAGVTSAIHH